MGVNIKEILRMTICMEKDPIFIQMEINMKDNG